MRVVVAGGTGMVGRYVVEELAAAGQEPVVLARSRGVDLLSGGAGLDEAMEGAEAVVDVSNVETMSAKKAVPFFDTVGRNLLDAGARAAYGTTWRCRSSASSGSATATTRGNCARRTW